MVYEPIILLLYLFSLQSGVDTFTIYNARLGSGSAAYSGRVEVLTSLGWLPVCSRYTRSWGAQESEVLCHQLGYHNHLSYSTSSSLTSASSIEFSFSCSGAESSLSQCYYTLNRDVLSSCSSGIVTVNCGSCSSGSVQLRGGVVPEAGTVEYCSGGTWKAVCHSNWYYQNAFVVCRQLGLSATDAIQYQNSHFGTHLFPLGNYYNCFGNESSLSGCQSRSSSCHSDDVAGVHCKGDEITDLCINGHIRLAGGRDTNEGRVEVCSNGVWGTIYDSGWDSREATVACRQLGQYQPHSRVELFFNSHFGHGSGPVLFIYLDCDGTESRLSDCSTYSSYFFGARHTDDAGVRCQRATTTTRADCVNGDVRLVNGTTPYEGRVEICYDGVWGSVCDYRWDYWDAAIVCLQMGFQGTNATTNTYFGDGEGPYHLSGLNCNGNENTLLSCPRSPSTIGYHTCSPGNDAGVRCDASVCSHGDVRWINIYNNQYGTAQVCISGLWANMCSYGSDTTAVAQTFCRQLMGQQSLFFGVSGGSVSGSKTLYSITCTGQTGVFTQDCSYSIIPGYSVSGCTIRSSMTIGCYSSSSCEQGDVRLVDGNSTLEGRVEFCTQGLWGAITTSLWDVNDARVVCRQLGLPYEWALADSTNIFGRGTSRIVARNFGCRGTEIQLSSCSYSTISLTSGISYQTGTTAGVICQGINGSRPTECNHGDVRLVNGLEETEGRVEICAYGYWAMACDSNWNSAATRLVCKQLGFPMEIYEYLSGSPFGSNCQLPLVGVSCNSGAGNISECPLYNQTNSCNHQRTVGVFCKEREHYQVEIQVSPPQESYEIGSRVTFSCIATPSSQIYQNSSFPLRYRWYLPDRGLSYFSSTSTLTINSYDQNFGSYYCLIYSLNSNYFLGQRRTTLNIKDFLKPSMGMGNPVKIQASPEQRNVTLSLQVNTADHNIADLLLGLTWYHNGLKIIPGDDPSLMINSNNMTLIISNYSSSYSGKYKAQFDQLFIYPYNENCKDEVLSLVRHYPVLKPVIFCVNVDGDCSDSDIDAQMRKISIRSVDSNLRGTFNNLTLEANATVLSRKELEHASIYWYRNGIHIISTSLLSTLQRHYNTLSLSQRFQQFNMAYEHSGTYEVQLRIDMNTYLQAGDSSCLQYYNNFISSYFGSTVILAKGYIDADYYKDSTFDLDANKEVTTRDEGATLTCGASIEFPPFSMISLIKNGQTLSSSTNPGSLQIDTKSARGDINQFGVYTCQLNASGVIFQKILFLKEQANLRVTLDVKRSNICSSLEMASKQIEQTLIQKIKRECDCSFTPDGFQNPTIDCPSSSELNFATTLEYSNEEGSETASIIAGRIVGQVPFPMALGRTQFTVTSACTDCRMPTVKASLSPADGGGLFIGGFLAAVLIAVTVVIVVIIVMKRRAKSKGTKGEKTVEVKTDPLRYTSSGASYQDVSFKGTKQTTPQPKKPSEYQPMGQRDQPSQYDTMQLGYQIYEETF